MPPGWRPGGRRARDRRSEGQGAAPNEQATFALGIHDDWTGEDGGGDLGPDGMPGPGRFKVWVEAPVAVATVAEVTLWLPGHQAMKAPLPLVAVTSLPF